MLNGDIGLPGPQPQPATVHPTTGKARIELERSVRQRYGSRDVLTQTTKRVSGPPEDAWVITGATKCSPSKFYAFAAVLGLIVGPAANVKIRFADRRQSKSRAVMGIAIDRLSDQIECLRDTVPVMRPKMGHRA